MMQIAGGQVANGSPATSSTAEPSETEEAQWKQVFEMLQFGGQADRGTHYALTFATLKRKLEEHQKKQATCKTAQLSLMKAAVEEVCKRPRTDEKEDITWGLALACAVGEQAREKAAEAAAQKPPYEATQIAQEAQTQVMHALEAQKTADAQAQMQASRVNQAQMHAQAVQVEAFKHAQAQALNMAQRPSLPLRPGQAPCPFYMRTGQCKYGQNCKWDHPQLANTDGAAQMQLLMLMEQAQQQEALIAAAAMTGTRV